MLCKPVEFRYRRTTYIIAALVKKFKSLPLLAYKFSNDSFFKEG